MTTIRVRRDRPTALAWSAALTLTMLAVYVLTLRAAQPDAVESVSAASRVTREVTFEAIEAWTVSLARCESAGEARILASGVAQRGAAGLVQRDGEAWRVLGAAYERRREAERAAERVAGEGYAAQVVPVSADAVRLRVTASEAQIDALVAADALLRKQSAALGDMARQLDKGEMRPEAMRTLCAVAAGEASDAARALASPPGAPENALCAGLIERLEVLSGMLGALSESPQTTPEGLSGQARCAQLENLLGQAALQGSLKP